MDDRKLTAYEKMVFGIQDVTKNTRILNYKKDKKEELKKDDSLNLW